MPNVPPAAPRPAKSGHILISTFTPRTHPRAELRTPHVPRPFHPNHSPDWLRLPDRNWLWSDDRSQGWPFRATPRTDPYVKNYFIRLLPWV